ncbi:MAG: tetratricopeptide repeat protein [Alloprevotella sp.]|nr:tetratricopeptide repeat protein [Alloprevotella sp.]
MRRALYTLLFLCALFTNAGMRAQINVENVVDMGRQALGVDDNISAIHYFNKAIEARPTHSRAYYYRAYAKFVLEDYGGAIEDCSKSIELNPFIVEVYQLRGLCRVQQKDFRGAVSDYERTLRERPTDEAALFNRALCYLELHEPDSAEAGMDAFLELKPDFYRAYMFKAEVELSERKDTLKALAWIDSVLVRHEAEPSAWLFKGQWAAQHEAYAEADSFLTKAITFRLDEVKDSIRDVDYQWFLMRAQIRHELNRFEDALADYDRVIEIIPEHFAAHYNRALLLALVGDDHRAIEDFTFILDVEPDNTLARYNRALLREETGDLQGAIEDYSVLIRAYPGFLYGYQQRAQLRRRTGDIRGAQNDETVLARYSLDLAFAKPQRSFMRKVRKRSDHALDQYDQVISTVEETIADTVRVFGDAIFGKVQNTPTERELLPMFSLALYPSATSGYRSEAFSEEVELMGRRVALLELRAEQEEIGRYVREPLRRLLLSAEVGRETVPTVEAHIECLRRIQERDSILAETDYLLLMSALERSIYHADEARALADSALRLAPDDLLASFVRATLPDVEKALRSHPSHPILLYNRACLRAKAGDLAAARADLDSAIVVNPRFAEAYYNRAVVLLMQGEDEAAAPDLSRAGGLGLHKAYNLLKQISKRGTSDK